MKTAVKSIRCSVCKTRFTPKYSSFEKCSKICEIEYRKRKENGRRDLAYGGLRSTANRGNAIDGKQSLYYPIEAKQEAKKGIRKVSQKQAKANHIIAKIKEELIKEHDECCQSCGKYGGVDLSHLVPRSQRKDLETTKANMCLMCRNCHTNYEGLNAHKMIKFKNIEYILDYMKEVHPPRYYHVLESINKQLNRSI